MADKSAKPPPEKVGEASKPDKGKGAPGVTAKSSKPPKQTTFQSGGHQYSEASGVTSDFLSREYSDTYVIEDDSDIEKENPATQQGPFNLAVLDPELQTPPVRQNLSYFFPDEAIPQEVLDKDEPPTPGELQNKFEFSVGESNAYLEFYQMACAHRRKVFRHISLLSKKLKGKDTTFREFVKLQKCAENTRELLVDLNQEISQIWPQESRQKTSCTKMKNSLMHSIEYMREEYDRCLVRDGERKTHEAQQAKQKVTEMSATTVILRKELKQTQSQLNATLTSNSKYVSASEEEEESLPFSTPQTASKGSRTTKNLPNWDGADKYVDSQAEESGSQHRRSSDDLSYHPEQSSASSSSGEEDTTKRRSSKKDPKPAKPRKSTTDPRDHSGWGTDAPPPPRHGSGRGGRGGHASGSRHRDHTADPIDRLIDKLDQRYADRRNRDDKKPNYAGLGKTEMETFSGDAGNFDLWRKKFALAHEGRNLSRLYKARALHNLLRGEAKLSVDIYMTKEWNDSLWYEMIKTLEMKYGNEHIQASCILEKLASCPNLNELKLKPLEQFFGVVTTLITFYSERQPTAVNIASSPLYTQVRAKLSGHLFREFIKWLGVQKHKIDRIRTLVNLQLWLYSQIKIAQEAEITEPKPSKDRFREKSSAKVLNELQSDSDDSPDNIFMVKDGAGRDVAHNFRKNQNFKPRTPLRYGGGETRQEKKFEGKPSGENRPPYKKPDRLEEGDKNCPICKVTEHELDTCPKFLLLDRLQRYAIVQYSRSCYHCLRRGHRVLQCRNRKRQTCGVEGCGLYEHPLIHPDATVNMVHMTEWIEDVHGPLEWCGGSQNHFRAIGRLARPGAISIQTIVCNLQARPGQAARKVIAILDSGSTTTLIDEDFAASLELERMSRDSTKVYGMIKGYASMLTRRVEIPLTSSDGSSNHSITGETFMELTDGSSVVDWSVAKNDFDHLRDIPFESLPPKAKVQLLIGADNPHLFAMTEGSLRTGPRGEPIAYHTPLGWTCIGSSQKPSEESAERLYARLQDQLYRQG